MTPPPSFENLARELRATDRLMQSYIARGEVPPAALINWRVDLRLRARRIELDTMLTTEH